MTKPAPSTSSELPANPSHEMRNALACIQQFGSILIDGLAGELSGEQREYIGIMLENASKIRRVLDSEPAGIDGLLNESKIKIERVSRLEN
jgi:signal transduction histidine kinase